MCWRWGRQPGTLRLGRMSSIIPDLLTTDGKCHFWSATAGAIVECCSLSVFLWHRLTFSGYKYPYLTWYLLWPLACWRLCYWCRVSNPECVQSVLRSFRVHYENCVSCYNAWIIVLLCLLWQLCFMLQCMNYRLVMFITRTVFHATMHELSSCYVHYENYVSCYNAWTIVLLSFCACSF